MIKIKKFAKEYIAKVLRKVEKSKRDRPPSSAVSTSMSVESPSMSHDTPHSAEDADDSMGVEMTVEEAMDMESDSESEAEEHDDHEDHEQQGDEGPAMISMGEALDVSLTGLAEQSPLDSPILSDVANEPMTVKDLSRVTTDPRRRPCPDIRC
jgi:[histone H3]-lysine36 N-trimethyltransferase